MVIPSTNNPSCQICCECATKCHLISLSRVPTTSLDDCKEEDEEDEEDESFHQFHCCRMQQSSMQITTPQCQVMRASPSKSNWIDLMWQTMRWLQNCETSLDEDEDEEISWWLLVSPLTNGSDATTKDLTRWLMAAWKWVGAVSESPICPPKPTILNIRQFLDEDLTGHGWSQQQWLLAYAHMLQSVGEATDRRTWRPNGKHFTSEISILVDAFLEVTNMEVVEADVTCCWSEPPQTILQRKDGGTFANVISHLDNLAQCLPMRKAWDELVCPPPSAVPRTCTRAGT